MFTAGVTAGGGGWEPLGTPYFDNSTKREATAAVGQPAYLHCRVRNLADRAVRYTCHTIFWFVCFLNATAASPNCEACNKIEDVQHLLRKCVKNKKERECLARDSKLNLWDVGLIQNILAYPTSERTKRIICDLMQNSLPAVCVPLHIL